MNQAFPLPDNLPVPEDDGACDHLQGSSLPHIKLPSTDGSLVDLGKLPGTCVIYCYPLTGQPGLALPNGWDEIPGARGCTPQSCSFRDDSEEYASLEATVFGLSTQDTDYQKELKDRLHLPYELLSDSELLFAEELDLPTFKPAQDLLIKRLTLIIKGGTISKVFYPVFPPDKNSKDVLDWLRNDVISSQDNNADENKQ